MRFALVAFALLFASGCASRGSTIPLPDLTYTSFGVADPKGDAQVVVKWKGDRDILIRNAKDPSKEVRFESGRVTTVGELAKDPLERLKGVEVLVDTFPQGLNVSKNSAQVDEGSKLKLMGKFTIAYRGARSMQEALDDVRVLVAAAGGNLAVISWDRDSQTTANGAFGVVLTAGPEELDKSKLKSGKVTEL